MRDAERLYHSFNACDLDQRLRQAAADGVVGAALTRQLTAAAVTADPGITAPGVAPDPLLPLPRTRQLTPHRPDEIAHVRQGTLQFGPFLWLNAPTLEGDVVWARDLGDEMAIRALYPERTIYRYQLVADGRGELSPPLP